MGFFKNIFKRKKGGTFVGNLIRGAASKATGGILGSGAGLAKWEAEQDAKKFAGMETKLANMTAKLDGRKMGGDAIDGAMKHGMLQKPTSPNMGENVVLETAKKWWWAIALGVVTIGGLIFLLVRKGSGSGKKNNAFKRLK